MKNNIVVEKRKGLIRAVVAGLIRAVVVVAITGLGMRFVSGPILVFLFGIVGHLMMRGHGSCLFLSLW